MKTNTKLQENLQDFIEERIQESYSKVSNKKDYKEKYNQYKELETNFIEKLQDKTMIDNYYNFGDIRMDLDTRELQEAYLLGFKDSIIINN